MVMTKNRTPIATKKEAPYRHLLMSPSGKQWKRIGIQRRSGVAVALFSIFSEKSIGIGEISDLKLLVDWCKKSGLSFIQLLPLNDVGFHFRPYDADSAFALDPMYLSLHHLKGVDLDLFHPDLEMLKMQFPPGIGTRVNYEVKGAKLRVLWDMFITGVQKKNERFQAFRKSSKYWLEDYALFRVLKQKYYQKSWTTWPQEQRDRDRVAIETFRTQHERAILFHEWQQWQLYEQMKDVKCYASEKGVLIMGDLPLLVSKDSADVWGNRRFFDLDRHSGAPPDSYYVKGQRWGMPIYDWSEIKMDNYRYLGEKLKFAQEFYDLFRIDHAVGLFRIWAIPKTEPVENHGLNGSFIPPKKSLWESQGRRLLEFMVANSFMLPCAEDLGTIPKCTFDTLKRLGLPGMEVQRWQKDSKKDFMFKSPSTYRKNSMALLSNHDMPSFSGWWQFEAATVEERIFERACRKIKLSFPAVKRKLFDLGRSQYGRLRWKAEIKTVKTLCRKLALPPHRAKELILLYQQSFNEQTKFWKFLGMQGLPTRTCSPQLVEAAILRANASTSIFSVQFLHDWLSLIPSFKVDAWKFRINFPGTVADENWSLVMPVSLEAMLNLRINEKIREINEESGRV